MVTVIVKIYYQAATGPTRFLLECSIRYAGTAKELLSIRQELPFSDLLKTIFFSRLRKIPKEYQLEAKDIKFYRHFTINRSNYPELHFWAGPNSPVISVLAEDKIPALCNNKRIIIKKVPSRYLTLSMDIFLYSTKPTVFLFLINHLMNTFSEEEKEKILLKGNHLQLTLHQDDPLTTPYCYAYPAENKNYDTSLQEVFANCPEEYLCSEMTGLYRAYYFFFKKDNWISKKVITVNDLVEID